MQNNIYTVVPGVVNEICAICSSTIDIANIYNFGAEYARQAEDEAKPDTPITCGLSYLVPFDLANIGRETQVLDIWESFSFFLVSVVIAWTAIVLPVALLTQGFIGGPDHTMNKRKKRSLHLREILQLGLAESWEWERALRQITLDDLLMLLELPEFECRRRAFCEFHKFLTLLPPSVMKLYNIISHYMSGMKKYHKSIMTGLGRGDCSWIHKGCPLAPHEFIDRIRTLKRKNSIAQEAVEYG
ncbi:uncharacterized protein LOC122256417 [Penaeus japonicus]|uniref:uncharacterized protein LOC122256417 n=1 Tax=Penaeus japonicus TaxID=27405 RepID=UPI001C70FF99|nr:uncharacterized protein LOC122256417 [Penaeus japonicus]